MVLVNKKYTPMAPRKAQIYYKYEDLKETLHEFEKDILKESKFTKGKIFEILYKHFGNFK